MLLIASADAALMAQAIPTLMAECDADQCDTGQYGASTWTFNGMQGTMVWPAVHAAGTLKIQQWDSSGVVIIRDDTAGPAIGLHVVYKGKINSNHIEGDAVWNLPSKGPEAHQVKWHAIFNTGPSFVPAKQQSIDGVWHLILPQTPGVVYRFKILQTGDQVKVTWIDTNSWKDGTVLFHGRFVSATTIEGESQAGDYTLQNPHMLQGHLTLDGPNRMLGSLGGVSDRGQGPPSRPPTMQARRPAASAPSPLAMLLLGTFAIASGPQDPATRLLNFQDADPADCHPLRPDTTSEQKCAEERDEMRQREADTRHEVAEEIQALKEKRSKLSAQCSAGNQQACQQMKDVDHRINADQDAFVGIDSR